MNKTDKVKSEPESLYRMQTEIREGDFVIHQDYYGTSEGYADSDVMRSRLEIKVRFTSGPRKGECRWVDANLVTKGESREASQGAMKQIRSRSGGDFPSGQRL